MGVEELARVCARPLQASARRAWARRGVPLDGAELGASCLVVAPHPDDETLGCGATIARKVAAGARVHVVVATDGRASHTTHDAATDALVQRRRSEALAACRELGLAEADVTFLDLVDGRLDRSGEELRSGLAQLLDRLRPEQVLVTASCDGHPDHDAAARAVAAVAAGRDLQVLEYPVWMWTHWPFTRPRAAAGPLARLVREPWRRLSELRPRTVATEGGMDAKRRALARYESQVGDGADAALPPSFVAMFLARHELFLPGGSLSHLGEDR